MKQTSTLTRKLASAQETHIRNRYDGSQAMRYSLYTEDKGNIVRLLNRYFPNGATVHRALGFWQGLTERSIVIEVIATRASLQRILDLAGDIRVAHDQQSVLVTWEPISRLEVTAEDFNLAAV